MKNKKGSIIVFALIVLSFILVAAFSIAAVTLVERRSANVSINSSTAFQNADKGMEEFLQQLYKEMRQDETLADMATNLGMTCVNGDGSNTGFEIPAYMGSDGSNGAETEFIITAYREGLIPETPDGLETAGWRTVIAITDCDTALADVARFKASGNYNNAARAVFLKLRDSLSRGLIARWSFEDRAQIAHIVQDSEREKRISFIAQDSSKQNHVLTLCRLAALNIPEDTSNSLPVADPADAGDIPIEVSIETDEGTNTYFIDEFDACEAIDPGYPLDFTTAAMSPHRGYNDDGNPEYDAAGSWVKGIVEEEMTGENANPVGDDSTDEALYFNDRTYLAMYTDNGCDADTINCIEELGSADSEDDLQMTEGIAISLWVNTGESSGYLVSRHQQTAGRRYGYEVYVNGGKISFRLNNTNLDSGSGSWKEVDDDMWHHVVARWSSGEQMEIYIDGKRASGRNFNDSSIQYDGNDILTVGARNNSGTNISDWFTGTIDDMRIWDRSVTPNEICRLCKEAFDQGNPPTGAPVCDCTIS